MKRNDQPPQFGDDRNHSSSKPESGKAEGPHRIGNVLIDLRNSLMRARKCRKILGQQDFSEERWTEIIAELDPAMRSMVHPQILDAIAQYLASTGKPVGRRTLVRDLSEQGTAVPERLRQYITLGLRNGQLARFPGKTIGLPQWKG